MLSGKIFFGTLLLRLSCYPAYNTQKKGPLIRLVGHMLPIEQNSRPAPISSPDSSLTIPGCAKCKASRGPARKQYLVLLRWNFGWPGFCGGNLGVPIIFSGAHVASHLRLRPCEACSRTPRAALRVFVFGAEEVLHLCDLEVSSW